MVQVDSTATGTPPLDRSVEGAERTGTEALSPRSDPPRQARAFLRRHLTLRLARRVLVRTDGVLGALIVIVGLGALKVYNFGYATSVLPSVLLGLRLSGELLAFILPVGFVLGLFLGWGRTSRSAILRSLGSVYVDFFRSMPPLGLIYFTFILSLTALSQTNLDLILVQKLALWIGVGSLALHTGAYQAEIFRAGIQSVPAGQTEAADAIGMSRGRSMVRVVLPQAFRVSLPALGNEFSSVIKDSSLLNVIGWLELSGVGLGDASAALFRSLYFPIIVWLEVGVMYFVLTYAVNSVVRAVENSFRVPGLEAAHL